MIVLDLKAVIFGIGLALAAAAGLTWWIARCSSRTATPGDGSLLAVLDAAPFGWLVLEGSLCNYANVYAQRLLHLPGARGELPDADWTALLAEDRAAAHQEPQTGRYRTVTFASEKTARWWVTSGDGSPARDFVFMLDVTAQQHTEQAGRALLNDLAHELRTPIAAILTHLEILGLSDVGADVHRQSLALSQDEAQRMARLLNDMLELGRLETSPELARRPLDLVALVEEVVLQSTPRAVERQMPLTLEAASPLPLVNGNADRLRQVFLNLLDNAFKYARPGDRVTMALQRAPAGVACAVCDTGPGIPPEHLPYVTRRFYRAAPKSIAGSGLGLALVAEILRRHDSALTLESPVADGHGLCARFTLPT